MKAGIRFTIVIAAAGAVLACDDTTEDSGSRSPPVDAGQDGGGDASSDAQGGSGGASGGTSGDGSGGSGLTGACWAGVLSGAAGAPGGFFCGLETCEAGRKCCPFTGRCYDVNAGGCGGTTCGHRDGGPAGPSCCPQGTTLCAYNDRCYHAGCTECCKPSVACNQNADCPSGSLCCYGSRSCYQPAIESCFGGIPPCAADGTCPGNLTCCKQYGICLDPGCSDWCRSECAPPGALCSTQRPCCGDLTCCSAFGPGGSCYLLEEFCPISDRNVKHGIEPIDPDAVLDKVMSLPISSWSYDATPAERHIGSMAQDFHAAFGTGASDRCIATVDENGVALAAVQALARRVERLERENAALRRDLEHRHGR